jgi:phage baseplate assembly protein gpV
VDGVDTNGFYLPIINNTNAPLEKEDVINDYRYDCPGEMTTNAEKNITIHAGKTATIKTSNGNEISIREDGSIYVKANEITIETDSLQINGKEVATVGAVDSAGQALVSRGW